MQYKRLGSSGIKVSEISVGMYQAGGSWGPDSTDDDFVNSIVRAHELGINLVDTAELYGHGHSEEVLASAIRKIGRENLVIATKVHAANLRYDHVLRSCEASLRRLGIKEIDLYQVHWPDPWEQIPLRHTFRAMEELQKKGSIRAIGVSNFAVRDLEEAKRLISTEIASNQVKYNLLQREIEEEVVPYCKKEDIAILAWSPLAQGALTGKYGEHHRPSDEARRENRLFDPDNMKEIGKLLSVLDKVAEAHGKTKGQVSANWLASAKDVIPIIGVKNTGQVEEAAGASGWTLTPDEVRSIESASSATRIDYFPYHRQ